MREQDFNEKYKEYLEPGSNGLEVTPSYEVMKIIDKKFQEWIKKPNFKYSLITYKNGFGQFHATGITIDEIYSIEKLLTNDK